MHLDSEVSRLGDGISVVTVKGRLTLGSRLSLFEAQLNSLIESGADRIILDLARVEYADSSGMGVLLHAVGVMRNKHQKMIFAGPNESLLKFFELTNTTPLLSIAPDLDAAIQQLR